MGDPQHAMPLVQEIGGLGEVESAEELRTSLRRLAERLGFDHYLFAQQMPGPPGQEPSAVIINGYPTRWRSRYVEQAYIRVDPTVPHCLASTKPFLWSPAVANGRTAEFWQEAADHGLAHGVSIASHDKAGVVSMLSLARARPIDALEAPFVTAAARTVVCTCHFSALRITPTPATGAAIPQLTPKELQVLAVTARGTTAAEAAAALGIRPRTVGYHLGIIYQKLGVRNKAEAVAYALQHGLVEKR